LLLEADVELAHQKERSESGGPKNVIIKTPKLTIRPRGPNQQRYVKTILANDINFGVGPAGTGKTYLAVACAVEALMRDDVQKILLVRPAVEAGEKLGFFTRRPCTKNRPVFAPLVRRPA